MGLILLAVAAAAPHAAAHMGYGIVADGRGGGGVTFFDVTGSHVWRREPDGRFRVLFSGVHGNTLVPGPDGSVYIEHFNSILWRIDSQGRASRVTIPGRSERVGSLDEILAVDAQGRLYFAAGNDFRPQTPGLLRLERDGTLAPFAAGASWRGPKAGAWGPDGALYVTDGPRVRRVTLDGAVDDVTGASFSEPLGLAVDERKRVWVADSGHRRVCRVEDGRVTTVSTTEPPWLPGGVAVQGETAFVLERAFDTGPLGKNAVRVVRLRADGTSEVLVTKSTRGPWPPVLTVGVTALALAVGGAWGLRGRLRRRRGR